MLQTLRALHIKRGQGFLAPKSALDEHGAHQEIIFRVLTGKNFDAVV